MKTWKLSALGAVVLAAGALGLIRGKHARDALLGPPDKRLQLQLDWPRGTKETYAFTWRGESATSLGNAGAQAGDGKGGSAIGGQVDLEGDLVVESFGIQGGAYLLREHVENLRRHELRVLGKDVMPTDADAKAGFAGKTALVAVDAAGTVRQMFFAKDEDPLFQHVMQSIITHTTMTVAPNGQDGWDAVEANDTGTAKVHYAVEETDPPRVERQRLEYTHLAALLGRTASASSGQVSSTSQLELDAQAHRVTALTDDEDVTVKNLATPADTDLALHDHFTLKFVDAAPFDAGESPIVAQLDARTPGEIVASSRADEQIAQQRIAGLTYEELKTTLLAYGVTGSAPSHAFLSRATGFLAQNPGACMDLAALFESSAMTRRGREQALELLAGAGTPAAQEAMRTALESPVAHSDPKAWDALVQRFSLVQRPTPDSVRFVAAAYREATTASDRAASAYALGASAGNLARSGGDRAVVRASEAKLLEGAKAAKTPDERRNMLGALGNLGLAEDESAIAAFAKDDAPEVRSASAWALRKIDDEDARSELFGFAADGDPAVATSAFQAIAYQTMTSDDWSALARVVTSGATPPQSDNALLTLLSDNTSAGAPIAQMLQALAARNTSDNSMEARIAHVLHNVQ